MFYYTINRGLKCYGKTILYAFLSLEFRQPAKVCTIFIQPLSLSFRHSELQHMESVGATRQELTNKRETKGHNCIVIIQYSYCLYSITWTHSLCVNEIEPSTPTWIPAINRHNNWGTFLSNAMIKLNDIHDRNKAFPPTNQHSTVT